MWSRLRGSINDMLQDKDPATIVLGGAAFVVGLHGVLYVYETGLDEIQRSIYRTIYGAVQAAAPNAGAERDKVVKELAGSLDMKDPDGVRSFSRLPAKGLEGSQVISQAKILAKRDEGKWKNGQVSGCVYFGEQEHSNLMKEMCGLFAWSNPLHPDVFPSVRKFESEVIAMTLDMMNGDPGKGHCGVMTSGGTESILMAVRAYKGYARAQGKTGRLNLVVSSTTHPAFHKACDYFEIDLVIVPVDGKTFQADVPAMERKINRRTIAIVGSAPEFPHGMIDDIESIAKVALKHKIGCHVDSCLGGFLLPFARALPEYRDSIPAFDMSVPGVTSMSADTHKYAYTVKGTSVLLFNSPDLRKHMYHCYATWSGGTYASPSVSGSRCGMTVAACWASLVSIGRDGFLQLVAGIMKTARAIKAGVQQIDGVGLVGDPQAMVIALCSDKFDVRRLGTGLSKRGWNLNQLQDPPSLHFTLTAANIGVEHRFLADVRSIVAEINGDPKIYTGGATAIYGLADRLPDTLKDVLIGDLAFAYIDALLEPPKNPTQ